jgi:hypothetical protein
MRQAFHIFKKDVRGLTYEIVVTLLLIAAFAIADSTPPDVNRPQEFWRGVLKLLLPLTWWFLTARVVQNEAIAGDRQFWTTRPYSWKSLLAAKVAFLLAFVSLPMMISDAAILHGQGFPVFANAGGILFEMLLRLVSFVLFAMILATFTRGLGSFTITALTVWIAFLFAAQFLAGFRTGRGAGPYWDYSWTLVAGEAALVPAAILFQYARGQRVALALTLSALALPLVSQWWTLPAPVPGTIAAGGPELQFTIDPAPKRIFSPRSTYDSQEVPLVLPIEISGIPAGLEPRETQVIVRMGEDGKTWQPFSAGAVLTRDRSVPDPRFYWAEIKIPRRFYQGAANQMVSLNMWVSLTLYRNNVRTALTREEFALPGVGYCRKTELLRSVHLPLGTAISIRSY